MDSDSDSEALLKATVIVPVAGVSANLGANFRSFLQQDYPAYTVIFVTQDEHDQAVPVIKKRIAEQKSARHINAGKAVACSQKNYNLLQGVLASDPSIDVLVFCDSGHYAHPRWLAQLLHPLEISPFIVVSSGYHHVFPEKGCICSTGRAVCVLALYLMRKIPYFSQPWGGALAIRKIDFEQQGIAELWGTTVVDDVTLAAHLQKKKIKVAIPTDADLQTVVDDCSWQAWESWLIRQWAYLKFLFPRLWLFAGLATIAFSFLVFFSILIVATGAGGFFPRREVIVAIVFLTVMAVGASIFRLQHPAPGSLVFWLPALLAAMVMAGWCHCRTWFSDSITWAGVTYTVAAGGKVVKIIRPKEGKEGSKQDGEQ
ncbi:MAG: glycosyltransferase [Pseudomonadota bacterium]